jgi:predicted nucleic acid-binding protein
VTHYIDATVALYAASRAQRYKTAAVEVLRAVASGTLEAVTSAAVIEDITYRFTGFGRPDEGLELADQFMRVIPVVYDLTHSDLSRAFALLRAEPRLSFRAALHGAIMKNHGVQAVISVEGAFDLLSGCQRVDLADWPGTA